MSTLFEWKRRLDGRREKMVGGRRRGRAVQRERERNVEQKPTTLDRMGQARAKEKDVERYNL